MKILTSGGGAKLLYSHNHHHTAVLSPRHNLLEPVMESPLEGQTTSPKRPCANVGPSHRTGPSVAGTAGRQEGRQAGVAHVEMSGHFLGSSNGCPPETAALASLLPVQGYDSCFSALNLSQVIMESHAPGTEGRSRHLHRGPSSGPAMHACSKGWGSGQWAWPHPS